MLEMSKANLACNVPKGYATISSSVKAG